MNEKTSSSYDYIREALNYTLSPTGNFPFKILFLPFINLLLKS